MKKRYTKTLLLRMEPSMHRGLKRSAKEKKMEMATFCRGALANAIAKHEEGR